MDQTVACKKHEYRMLASKCSCTFQMIERRQLSERNDPRALVMRQRKFKQSLQAHGQMMFHLTQMLTQ